MTSSRAGRPRARDLIPPPQLVPPRGPGSRELRKLRGAKPPPPPPRAVIGGHTLLGSYIRDPAKGWRRRNNRLDFGLVVHWYGHWYATNVDARYQRDPFFSTLTRRPPP